MPSKRGVSPSSCTLRVNIDSYGSLPGILEHTSLCSWPWRRAELWRRGKKSLPCFHLDLQPISSSGCPLSSSPQSKSQNKHSIGQLFPPQSSISSLLFPVVCPHSRAVCCWAGMHCRLPLLFGVDVLVIPSRVVPRLSDLSPVEVRGNTTNRTISRAPFRCHLYSILFNSLDAPLNAPTKRMASQ